MDYVISGLPLQPFQSLFGLDDAQLFKRAVRFEGKKPNDFT